MKTNIPIAALAAAYAGDIENFIAATTPDGIEAQEKRGQIEQSFAETLPIKGTSSEADRQQFDALGFKFKMDRTAAQNQGRQELFVEVEFPKGWRKKVTDHDMWTDLIDGKERKRGSIFYKAAFYDRSAHIYLNQRYEIERYSNDNVVSVTDCGKRFHVIGSHAKGDYKAMDIFEKEAREWLEKNLPDWKNVSAYWDK